MKLPTVGVFDARSDDRVVQGTAVRRLLAFVRGTDGIAFRGRRILLNSNPRWLARPVYGGVVSELAAALSRYGATVLLADVLADRGESSQTCSAAPAFAVEAGEPPWQRVSLDCRKFTRLRLGTQTFRLPKLLFEVDLVVNIAGLFMEPRARLAGAMYNMMGLLCGRSRRDGSVWSLDPASFNATMVDIVSRISPDLNILVVPNVEPELVPVNEGAAQLLVSTDVVAVDTLAASLAGFDPREIPAVSLAAESGLGIGWIEAIKLAGDRPRFWVPGPLAAGETNRPDQIEPVYAGDHLDVRSQSDFKELTAVRPVGVTYCPGGDLSRTLAAVAMCVGDVKCDSCARCVGACPVLLN